MTELKPCPFCGGEAEVTVEIDDLRSVECTSCGALVDGIDEWNTRAVDGENAELRELVADMWFWGYCGHMDSKSQEWQMKHIDGVIDRMRELGVEVDG